MLRMRPNNRDEKTLEDQLHKQYAENDNSRSGVLIGFLTGIIALFGFYGFVFVNTNKSNEYNIDIQIFLLMSIVTIGILFFMALLALYLGSTIRRDQIIVYNIRKKRYKNLLSEIFGELYSPLNKNCFNFIHSFYYLFYWLFYSSELFIFITTTIKIFESAHNCFMYLIMVIHVLFISITFFIRFYFYSKYLENFRKINKNHVCSNENKYETLCWCVKLAKKLKIIKKLNCIIKNILLFIFIIVVIIATIVLCLTYQNKIEKYTPEKYFLSEEDINENYISITGYSNQKNEIKIPPQINYLPVTYIATGAFKDKKLISVTIPNNVKGIGMYAFADNKLKEIFIPKSVTYIGDKAFRNNHLSNVSISESVVIIGAYAFADNQITNIKIGENVQIEEGAFEYNFIKFYQDNGKITGQYVYENGNWEMKE